MTTWINSLTQHYTDHCPAVIITILNVKGSTPREPGTKMLISPNRLCGTIGGGNLEFQAIAAATLMMTHYHDNPETARYTQTIPYPLGSKLGQCCGGYVLCLFELFVPESKASQSSQIPEWLITLKHMTQQQMPCVLLSYLSKELVNPKKHVITHTQLTELITQQSNTISATTHPVSAALTTKSSSAQSPAISQLVLKELEPQSLDELITCSQAMLHNPQLIQPQFIPLGEDNNTQVITKQAPINLKQHDYLLLEPLQPSQFNITLFGAGHVGKALIDILQHLDCHIRWCDSRAEQFPSSVPNNVSAICHDTMEDEIALSPKPSYFLVLTHSHALDYQLIEALLKQVDKHQQHHTTQINPIAFCGLIGSASKKQRFIHRLKDRGFSQQSIDYLTCPIGLDTIKDKTPHAIAVSIAAQLLALHEQ